MTPQVPNQTFHSTTAAVSERCRWPAWRSCHQANLPGLHPKRGQVEVVDADLRRHELVEERAEQVGQQFGESHVFLSLSIDCVSRSCRLIARCTADNTESHTHEIRDEEDA